MNILRKSFHLAVIVLTIIYMMAPMGFLPVQEAKAATQISDYMTYQGRLKNAAGTALTGSYAFIFSFYDAAAAGNLEWTETQAAVTVTSGYFSATLGETTAFGAGLFNEELWLQISVGGEAMSSRVKVNSAAFSMSTRGAENLAAAPTAAAGRMYYNTADGNLYVYDAVAVGWVDVTSSVAGGSMDDTYDNFAAGTSKIVVDAGEGQLGGGLEFETSGTENFTVDLQGTGDFIVQDAGVAFATFDDSGDVTLTGDLAVNGTDITSTGVLTLNPTGALNLGGAATTSLATANTVATVALNGTGLTTVNVATANTGAATLNLATSNLANNVNIGTGNAIDTIVIGGGGTAADDIDIGDASADVDITGASQIVAGTGAALTLTANAASTWSASAGLLTVQGAAGITVDSNGGNLTLDAATGNDVVVTLGGAASDDLLVDTTTFGS